MIMSKKCEECLKGITKQHQEDLDFEKIKTLSEFKEKLDKSIGKLQSNIEFRHNMDEDIAIININDFEEFKAEIEKTAQEILR